MERVIDLRLEIDGILLKEGEELESLIFKIENIVNAAYPIQYEVVGEECFED